MSRIGQITALLCMYGSSVLGLSSYHVGNSLTWDMQPKGLEQLAHQQGKTLSTGWHICCGRPLVHIWSHPEDVCVDAAEPFGTLDEALGQYAWNMITVQPYPGEGSTLATDTEAIVRVIERTQEHPANAGTDFYIYAGWPRRGDYAGKWTALVPDEDDTPTALAREYFSHLLRRVQDRTTANVYVLPVGEVLFRLDEKMRAGRVPGYSSIEQFYRDDVHLTVDLGRFTAAATTLSTLFFRPPTGLAKPEHYYGESDAFAPAAVEAILDMVWEVVSEHPHAGIPDEQDPIALTAGGLTMKVSPQAGWTLSEVVRGGRELCVDYGSQGPVVRVDGDFIGARNPGETVLEVEVVVEGRDYLPRPGRQYVGSVVGLRRRSLLTHAFALESDLILDPDRWTETICLQGLDGDLQTDIVYGFIAARADRFIEFAAMDEHGTVVREGVTDANDGSPNVLEGAVALGQYDPQAQEAVLSVVTEGAQYELLFNIIDFAGTNKAYTWFRGAHGDCDPSRRFRFRQTTFRFDADPEVWKQRAGELTASTLRSVPPAGDINRDEIVNMADLAHIAGDWLQSTTWFRVRTSP